MPCSTLAATTRWIPSQAVAYGKTIGSEIRFIGVPKTIDNDLLLTDHTPGYGSAASTSLLF